MHGLLASALSVVFFGLWGFFSRLTIDHLTPMTALLFQTLGIMLMMPWMIKMSYVTNMSHKGVVYALLTGLTFALGSVMFFVATQRLEKISVVVTLTALYPIVTLLLAYIFLNECLNAQQWCGMVLAVMAIVCFSA